MSKSQPVNSNDISVILKVQLKSSREINTITLIKSPLFPKWILRKILLNSGLCYYNHYITVYCLESPNFVVCKYHRVKGSQSLGPHRSDPPNPVPESHRQTYKHPDAGRTLNSLSSLDDGSSEWTHPRPTVRNVYNLPPRV